MGIFWQRWLWLTLLVSLGAGSGCSSPKKKTTLDTPSGAPEVTIASAEIGPILQASREFFTGRGYYEAPSRHAYELIFDRRLGSGKKSQALRIRLRGMPVAAGSWKLAGASLKVDDWRGDLASESVVPYGFAQVQEFLEAIKAQVEQGRAME